MLNSLSKTLLNIFIHPQNYCLSKVRAKTFLKILTGPEKLINKFFAEEIKIHLVFAPILYYVFFSCRE